MNATRDKTSPGEVRLLAVTSILGYGFPESALEIGMQADPHMIGADAGSTDPGPYYLGAGVPFCSRLSIKRDTRLMLLAAVPRGIPVVISTCGGAGGEPHLQFMAELVREIAREEKLDFKLALIHAEQDKGFIKQQLAAGKVKPASRRPALTVEQVDGAERIVALMGPEPFERALENGAQVILAGRATDPSIWAAGVARGGLPPEMGWYAGKMLECGAEPAAPKRDGCLLARVYQDYIDLEPTNPEQSCTRLSVANFALHENPSAIHHYEPGGMLDTSACSFEQLTDRIVRVRGMKWVPADVYTVKMEGVQRMGYRAISMLATRDPVLIKGIDDYLLRVRAIVDEKSRNFGVPEGGYKLSIRSYGLNGVMGEREPRTTTTAHELSFILEVLAPTQEVANAVIAIARTTTLHADFPGRMCKEGNMGIPFSPADVELGASYEFTVYHIVDAEDPYHLFPIEYLDVTQGATAEVKGQP